MGVPGGTQAGDPTPLYTPPVILAGDVGGTKTLLGLFERRGGKLVARREASFPSRDFASLGAIVDRFRAGGKEKIDAFAVGVAGPVVAGKSQVVNLRWPVDAGSLSRKTGLGRVTVINDLEATGWGIPELASRKSVSLTPGLRPRPGNAALIAAGTGLGMSLLIREDDRWFPQSSEGGHQTFAPRSDDEIELLRYLRRRYGRVSVERLASGPAFSAIYQFLIDTGRARETARMTRRLAEGADANAVISAAGLAEEDRAAVLTLDWFVSLYGAAAGDLALVAKAVAGIWVGGGIAPKILPRLRRGEFVRAFREKGRLTPLLEKIPIRVIVEPRTALIGAAACAERGLKQKKG